MNLGMPEVQVDRIMDRRHAVRIKLVGYRVLFPEHIDGCVYKDGRCIRINFDKSGDACTNFLGSFYSSHRDIVELSFSKNNGVYIVPRFGREDPRYEPLIRQIAQVLIRRSNILSRLPIDCP